MAGAAGPVVRVRSMSGGVARAEAWGEFVPLWETLIEESGRPGTVIVVEGERDVRSLRRLGIAGRIVQVHQGRTLSHLAHELGEGPRRVIILTDWDSEGGVLARRLRVFLEAGHSSVDLEFRRRLARALRAEVVHVEGLAGWARRAAADEGQQVDRWLSGPEGTATAADPKG